MKMLVLIGKLMPPNKNLSALSVNILTKEKRTLLVFLVHGTVYLRGPYNTALTYISLK